MERPDVIPQAKWNLIPPIAQAVVAAVIAELWARIAGLGRPDRRTGVEAESELRELVAAAVERPASPQAGAAAKAFGA